MKNKILVHGHRGCRGHMPENTIEGFLEAFKLGADVIEMDVVLNKNRQVIISHEPFMNHITCLNPDGFPLSANESYQHNIYQMDIAQIRQYDCGSLKHPRFQNQKNFPAKKPMLSELVQIINGELTKKGQKDIIYNIEVKSNLEWEQTYQPSPLVYARIINREIEQLSIDDECMVQSFDTRILKALHNLKARYPLGLLSNGDFSPEFLLEKSGFIPEYFCIVFSHLNAEIVDFCHQKNMKLLVWTVNEMHEIKKAIDLGVNGIISDYPDKVKSALKN